MGLRDGSNAGGSRGGVAALGLVLAAACRAGAPAAPGPAAASPGTEMRFDPVRALAARAGVRSVDDLVPLLPEDVRSRAVLVFESRSAQPATYASPRVLLFSPDARFVLTYCGAPPPGGHDAVETMEFDDTRRAFVLREISFSPAGAPGRPVLVSEPNPPRCLVCHGETPRPIWDSYPLWPGVYGERAGARPGAREEAGFEAFRSSRASSPRYGALVGVEAAADPGAAHDAAGYGSDPGLSPNADLGLRLQALDYRSIAREVVTSPRFERFRFALLASLEPRCLDLESFLPDTVRAGFSRSLGEFEAMTRRANDSFRAAKQRRLHAPAAGEVVPEETLTPLRYLVEEGLGVPTREWTLALEKATYDFTSVRRAARVLELDLLDAVARTDPAVANQRRAGGPSSAYCAALRRRSLLELERR